MLIIKVILLTFLFLQPIKTYDLEEEFRNIVITEEFRKSFSEKAANIQTIQAGFRQEKFIAYLAVSVVSEGFFFYKKPNSIRWEFTNPYQYIIIVKDGTFQVHDSKGRINFKEKENEFFTHMNTLVQNSLCGNVFSENRYKTSLMASDNKYKLTIIPIEEKTKSLVEKVDVLLDKQTFNAESIVIYETSGDNTSIVFNNKKYNLPIDNKVFE